MGKGSLMRARLERRAGKHRHRRLACSSALVFVLAPLLLAPSTASATVLPETIKENMTLTAASNPYTGSPTIQAGVTVKVEPGVVLKVGGMTVKGILNVEGTAEEPVVFTGAKEKSNGEWCAIWFSPGSSTSVIDHAEIKYGGGCNTGAVGIYGSSPTIKNSTFSHSYGYAIKVPEGGSPEIANNRLLTGETYAIFYEATGTQTGEVNIHGNEIEGGNNGIYVNVTSTGTVTGKTLDANTVTKTSEVALSYSGPDIPDDVTANTLSANTTNVITLSGTVAHSETWNNGGTPVKFASSITVASGATLTITKGVLMRNPDMTVKGTLNVEGTSKEPVIFTGTKEKTDGEWCAISFQSGSSASVIDHAELRYGGGCNTGVIGIKGSSPTIKNSTFSHSYGYAIKVPEGGSPEISSNRIIGSGSYGIFYEAIGTQTGEVNIHGNEVEGGPNGIYVNITSTGTVTGKTLGANTITATTEAAFTYAGADIPGDITANTLSANTANVIVLSGTVAHSETWSNGGSPVKFAGSVTVASGATLTITKGVLIRNPDMTVKGSLSVEGTSAEPVIFTGAKEKSNGEWCAIWFSPGSGASVIDHAEVRYGGGCNTGAIRAVGSSPTIHNSTFSHSYGYAVMVTESGSPKIEWNRFRSNESGLSYEGTGKLSAPNNDWGCSSGPKPAGCGDSVTSNVSWKPVAELPELAGHCRGKSQCGKGADPVSLATGALDYSHRDLLLANKGSVPLEFARSYSSASSVDTGMGPGWAQSGLANASEQASGEVLIVRPDGRQDLFEKTETGYKAPLGVTDTLTKVEGAFRLTTLQNTVYAFDSSGRIASITDDHGLKTTYAYNESGRLSTITDPSAQTLTFTYSESNHIKLVKDSTGREVKFAYSAAGDLESVTDALGGVTKYAYDASHRLTSITDPRKNVILKNVYDGQGRIIEQKDGLENLWKLKYSEGETVVTEPQGGKLAYGFDGQDRVVSETDQLGNKTTTAYDSAGNVSEVVQPGGGKWTFGHDAAGNLTSVKDPEGGERKYEYDGQNRLTGFTDARGDVWSYEWSKANDLTKITDPEKGETTFIYNESGQPLTITDPAKHKTELSYDSRGNELSVTDPLSHKTSFEYNSRNYLTSQTLSGLKAESYERNALGDMLARTTPEGNKTKYAYDANGLPTQITDPGENIWKIERNAMERPTTYTDPAEQQIKVSYNGDLKPTKVINRRGKETTYAYDAANQLTEVDRPEGGDWTFGYDSRGNRSSVIDPREYETTYEYDALNRMVKAAEPLEVTTKYGYDANGDLTSVTDPLTHKTTYAYDKLGRLTEVAQPLEKTTKYAYDAAGNETAKTTAAGTLEYGYDAANRLTSIASANSTLRSFGYDAANRRTSATDAASHKIEIGYNGDGKVTSINDGRGQPLTRTFNSRGLLTKQEDGRGTLKYEYDKLGQMTSLTDPQGKALSFAYDPEGDLTEVKRPNGVTTTNAYNDAGRLAETTSKAEGGTVLEVLKYAYDAEGNVTSRKDSRAETETTYAYDKLGRLIEFNPPGEGSTAYGYDKAGNRTEAGGTTYEFNALNQLTEASSGAKYSYDDAGRMTGIEEGEEETTYEWDLFDHLAKAEGPAGTASYAYDALERLSERKAGAVTRVVHYGDLSDKPTYDADGEGKTTTSYVAGPGGLLEERSAEATSYPLSDAHGDIAAITGPTGTVESRQSYDPWGVQLSGPSQEMGYLGAYERPADLTTGLIQMGVRSYSPGLGSFLTEDPVAGHLGVGVSADRYPYVWDNPLARYDFNGRDVCVLGACASEAGEDIGGAVKDWVENTPEGNAIEFDINVIGSAGDRFHDFVKSLDCKTTGLILDTEGVAATSTGVVVGSAAPPVTAPAGGVLIIGGGIDDLLGVGFDVAGHEGVC